MSLASYTSEKKCQDRFTAYGDYLFYPYYVIKSSGRRELAVDFQKF
jgi:transcriptional regulator NrdR family protein